jgi:hypothetical protein
MLLFDMGEECCVAEVGFAAGTLIISGLDGDCQFLLEWVLFVHENNK